MLSVDDIERKTNAGNVEALLNLARECDARGDGAQAVEHLKQAAATGDLAAKAALGAHLLSEAPYDQREGARLTLEAAKAGNAEATHLLAVLAASGVVAAQSWSDALKHLERAAELGLKRAQAELAMLAGEAPLAAALSAGDAPASPNWERLRKAVDVRKWIVPSQARVVSSSPRIAVAERFFSAEICDWLIQTGRPYLRPAKTNDPATGSGRYETARTNSSAEPGLSQTDLMTHLVRARISALTGPPTLAMEGTAILHYTSGQQYYRHYDFFDTDSPGNARQVAQYGQRVLTFLGYLNDDYDGGETDFPKIGWRFKGRKGDGLFFWNILPSGQPDHMTQHAGLPPLRGEKWLLSQWVRGRVS